jgi:DNA-binding FadR family transcriptional regulator
MDVFDIRESLEHLSVVKATENRSEEDLRQLKITLDSMKTNLHSPITYVQLDAQFHTQIARASGNNALLHFISSIRQTMVSVNNSLRLELSDSEIAKIQANHEHIFVAITNRDVAAARRAIGAHFESVMRRLKRVLTADPA